MTKFKNRSAQCHTDQRKSENSNQNVSFVTKIEFVYMKLEN